MRRAATVVLGCLLLAACGPGAAPVASTAPVPSTAPARAGAVPADGDTVTGSGRLVQEPGGPVLFCGSEFSADVGYLPGQEPPPVACRDGVPLDGADMTALDQRFEKDGAVEGLATVTGTWRAGTLQVQEQGPPPSPEPRDDDGEVPCPEPEGGWPVTSEGDNMTAEVVRVRDAGGVPTGPHRFALLRPSDTQVLLGYAVPDEPTRARTQAFLDELVPRRSCVAVAQHTDDQIAAAQEVDWLSFGQVRSSGVGMRRLQAVVEVWTLVVTEPLQAEVDRHPEGLVRLTPDLRVVARPSGEQLEQPEQPRAAADHLGTWTRTDG